MFKKNLKNTFLFKSQEYSSIKVLALTRSLFYTNIDDLNKELNRSCCLEKKLDQQQIERNYFGDENDNEMLLCDSQNNYDTNFGKNFFSGIVLDCTRCNFIDESGAKCLKEIVDKYAKENVLEQDFLTISKRKNFDPEYFTFNTFAPRKKMVSELDETFTTS